MWWLCLYATTTHSLPPPTLADCMLVELNTCECDAAASVNPSGPRLNLLSTDSGRAYWDAGTCLIDAVHAHHGERGLVPKM